MGAQKPKNHHMVMYDQRDVTTGAPATGSRYAIQNLSLLCEPLIQ